MAKKRKRVYISGKISGLSFEEAFAKFDEAKDYFLKLDYDVVNPMNLSHQHDLSWESYMREDLKAMMDCDAIALLSNYRDSKGAGIEKELAEQLGFMIFIQSFLEEEPINSKSIMVFSRIN